MNKKLFPPSNTPLDTSDSYWLACIAQRENYENAVAANIETAPKETTPAGVTPAAPDTVPKGKEYPRNTWGASNSSRGPGTTQIDARVTLPASVTYIAAIDDGQRRHAVWSIRNMSLSGVFLDMDVNQIQEASAVDFLLSYKHQDRAYDYRIPAKVVRTQLNGLALCFNYRDAVAYYNSLVSLLYS